MIQSKSGQPQGLTLRYIYRRGWVYPCPSIR